MFHIINNRLFFLKICTFYSLTKKNMFFKVECWYAYYRLVFEIETTTMKSGVLTLILLIFASCKTYLLVLRKNIVSDLKHPVYKNFICFYFS